MYEGKCFAILPYLKYDGTNAQDIMDAGSGGMDGSWSLSEVDDILTIRCTYEPEIFEEWSVPLNGAMIFKPNGGIAQGIDAATFQNWYGACEDFTPPPVMNSSGIGNVPALSGDANYTLTVELKPAFPNDDYDAVALVTGGLGLLAKLEVESVTVIDESHVEVELHNTNLLVGVSAAKVLVQAVAN